MGVVYSKLYLKENNRGASHSYTLYSKIMSPARDDVVMVVWWEGGGGV